ncbi:TIGR04222 domain-containing membrane protein [Micromonospora sp. NPDC050397]|uniref:TIGR04222 domain-containing membrane protein n=1 Tax=Micromonospora sp. NPDC050397 TaxID=3364279 RepID=UPI00384DDF8C
MLIDAAAPADTWGISGPTFLFLYLAAAGLLILAAVVQRSVVFAGRRELASRQLTPEQAAYLNGGEQLAIYAALGGLRAAGSIDTTPGHSLTTSGPMPTGATPLDQAVYNAAGQRIRPRNLATNHWVRSALQDLRRQLEHDGLTPTTEQRRAARFFPLLLLGLLALGAVRLVAGIAGDKAVLFLVLVLAVLSVITLVLLFKVPKQTRAARGAVRSLRGQHTHLNPSSSPAYDTYGATSAAMGVALFGGAALYSLDPGFADQAEVQRNLASGGNSGGGSDGGGGSGGDGGGGGCGGGGCGGGCGG